MKSAAFHGACAREPRAGESLQGWSTRIARDRRRPHLWKLLGEVGLPYLAKPGALLRGALDAASIAAGLDAEEAEVAGRLLVPADAEGFELLGGVRVRARDVVTQTRRYSPRTLGVAGTHRQIWMLRTLPFCPSSWDVLTDACGRCGTVQRWKRSISVRRCDRCGSGLWTHGAAAVPDELRPALHHVAALVDRDQPSHANTLALLPSALGGFDAGATFEAVLAVARVLDPDLPLAEPAVVDAERQMRLCRALAAAWPIVLGWPIGGAELVALSSDPDGTLRRLREISTHSEGRPVLREVEAMMGDLSVVPARAIGVKPAARLLGVTEGDIARARRTGMLGQVAVIHRRTHRLSLDREEIEKLAAIRRDRISHHAAGELLGIPAYGIEQLVADGLLKVRRHAWLLEFHGAPVLLRHDVEALRDGIVAASGDVGTNPITLAVAMKACGGGPKPWTSMVKMLLAGRFGFEASVRTDGSLRVVVAGSAVPSLASLPRGMGRSTYSQSEAMEILNLSPKQAGILADLRSPEHEGGRDRWRLDGKAVDEIALKRVSFSELMAFADKSHKTVASHLRRRHVVKLDGFGFNRVDTLRLLADLDFSCSAK